VLKAEIIALQAELVKLAEENEANTMQKCAQILVAASGLKLLKNRLEKTSSRRTK